MRLRSHRVRVRVRVAVVAASIAMLAGCGSSVEPNASETLGPFNPGLGVPGLTITGTTPSTGVPGTTSPDGSVPTTSTGDGSSVLPTTGVTQPTTSDGGNGVPTSGSSTSSAPDNKGPITVGFLTTDTSNAAQYGASLGNTISESRVDKALIDAMNKKGGLGGRPIKLVLATTDTGASNWSNDFQAACATFTQDHHVDAVLGYEFNYEPNFESCLAKRDIPHLSNGFNVPSNAVLAKYPLFWSLTVPTIGERSIAKFQGAINTGFLTSKDKLGILLDTCPGTQEAWKTEVAPFLHAHHITVAPPLVEGCGTGQNAGTTSAVSGLTNGLLKLRSQGVNRISFVSVSEAPVLYVGSIEAQAQGYQPGWIVSSLGQLSIVGGEAPASQMRNTHGYGWLPSQDVPPAYSPKKNATQKRCLSLLAVEKLHPRSAADFGYAYNACEAVFVYERALKLDGGNTEGVAVSNAIASIGSSFQSTLNLEGRSTFSSATRNNAPLVYKPINWDGNCHCFRYGHATYEMP